MTAVTSAKELSAVEHLQALMKANGPQKTLAALDRMAQNGDLRFSEAKGEIFAVLSDKIDKEEEKLAKLKDGTAAHLECSGKIQAFRDMQDLVSLLGTSEFEASFAAFAQAQKIKFEKFKEHRDLEHKHNLDSQRDAAMAATAEKVRSLISKSGMQKTLGEIDAMARRKDADLESVKSEFSAILAKELGIEKSNLVKASAGSAQELAIKNKIQAISDMQVLLTVVGTKDFAEIYPVFIEAQKERGSKVKAAKQAEIGEQVFSDFQKELAIDFVCRKLAKDGEIIYQAIQTAEPIKLEDDFKAVLNSAIADRASLVFSQKLFDAMDQSTLKDPCFIISAERANSPSLKRFVNYLANEKGLLLLLLCDSQNKTTDFYIMLAKH